MLLKNLRKFRRRRSCECRCCGGEVKLLKSLDMVDLKAFWQSIYKK